MGCDFYKERLIEGALNLTEGRELDADLRAHLEQCSSCRAGLAAQRRLVATIDRGVVASVADEPSPEFAARLRQRLAEESRPARRWTFGWVPAAAGALAALVIFAFWLARRESPGPHPVASVESVQAPAPAPVTAAPAPRDARASVGRGERPRRPIMARAAFPEVLIPPGQEKAILSFYRAMQSGRIDGSALLVKNEQIEPAELKISPLEIKPLDKDSKSTERGQEH